MASLRGLQSTSTATDMDIESEVNAALTSATEGTTPMIASATSATPPSNSTTIITKKTTTSTGEVITTVTTTTTTTTTSTTSTSSTASTTNSSGTSTSTTSTSNSASNTTNGSRGTSTNSATNSTTEGAAGNVTTTTIITRTGSSPFTTVITDNGVNSTSTSTSRNAETGTTTVTTTTTEELSMSDSSSSTALLGATSGDSRTTTTSTSQETSGSASTASTTSTTTSSAAEAAIERASTSTTITNTGSSTSTSTTEGSSRTSTTTSGAVSSTATGSMASGNAMTTTSSSGTSSSTTTTTASSGATATTTTTDISSTGSKGFEIIVTNTNSFSGSEASSSATESSISSTTTSLESSANSANLITSSSSDSTSVSTTDSSSALMALARSFISSFRNEETQLVVGSTSSTTSTSTYEVCDGLPALVTLSDTETPNGGCPDELTALNVSCTCLSGYSETSSSWVFRVTSESTTASTNTTNTSNTIERPLTQTSSDELLIDTIRSIWVSSSLETLVIEGAGDSTEEIMFINENRDTSNSSLALIQSSTNSSNITTLSLYNLDLNTVAASNSGFVPVTVTDLTLRDCNISTLGSSFTRDWSSLRYVDLSSNRLAETYVGGDHLKELNVSFNSLTGFPWATMVMNTSALDALHIQGNDIADFNVTEDEFVKIQSLSAFTADQPATSSSCQDGAWQAAHGTTFCVLGASTAAVPDSSKSSGSNGDDDSNGLGIITYWLIGGAIVVFLLLLVLLWQRRCHDRENDSSPVVSPEATGPNTPKYTGNVALEDATSRDVAPVVAPRERNFQYVANTHSGYGRSHGNSVESEDSALAVSLANNSSLRACRLDYDEVTLGRCISRGGFGLVFVGSYRGRQVAVKKIRNERGVEREQVEQFAGEISLVSGLSHPRIVEFIGACWTTPAELSAVTELMERGDLRDVTRRFKRRGYRLTWETHKTLIALHIAEALVYLHGLSPTVIHRDLKAKNVLLNADMEAKLSDFGIARERRFYDGSDLMTVGIGTSFWIAPEVLLGRDYDERADVYSFGVVLSEIDTDDYPYWNDQHPPQGKAQENEILRLVARGAKRPTFSDNCPPAILELAARCLRADPDERPRASEIVLYLQSIMQERSSIMSAASLPRPGISFDLNTRGSITSPPSQPAPANSVVNLGFSSEQLRQQQTTTTTANYMAGKRSRLSTTKTTTTTTSSRDTGSTSGSHPTAAEALAPAHEIVVSPPAGVSRKVVRTKLPGKGKRTTTTTTTTTRRSSQGSAGVVDDGSYTIEQSSEDDSFRSFGAETVQGLPRSEEVSIDNNRQGQNWVAYEENVREL